MWTRAEFLRVTAAASVGMWVDGVRAAQSPPDADARARISRIIQQYDSQGIHRTATDGDNDCAQWLWDAVREMVPTTSSSQLMPFSLARVDVGAAYVAADGPRGNRAEGLPLFDGTFTDAQGISGTLAPAGDQGGIALVSVDAAGISSEGRSLQDLRRSGRYQAIVAVTRGAHEGLSPMNAVDFAAPYGVPVLQVGSEAGTWLEAAASSHAVVRFVAEARRTNTRAWNIAGLIPPSPGGVADAAPVVVMTPRSGWWRCASERGGGLACWMEAMRAIIVAPRARPVFFVASSGHELGHFGLDAYLSSQRGLIQRAAAWVHLGANIGAAGGRLRIQASSDEIEAMGLASLERVGAPVPQRVPRGNVPGGEARNIHVGGGRYVSLLGSSNVFHSQADRWPDAVNVDAVAKYAAAVSDLVVKLAS